jgi:hypothetical protein
MTTPDTLTTAEERAARGAALLDTRYPGWEQLIDRDTLIMQYCDVCILGQLYGSYSAGLRAIFAVTVADAWEAADRHGFCIDKPRLITYADQDEAWAAEITRRRTA